MTRVAPRQLEIDFAEREDWSRFEDHAVGGEFRPPMRDEPRTERAERGPIVTEADASRLRRDPGTATYRGTDRRLGGYYYPQDGRLVLLRGGEHDGALLHLASAEYAPRGWGWVSATLATAPGAGPACELRLTCARAHPVEDLLDQGGCGAAIEGPVRVVRDGGAWVATFEWCREHAEAMERAGFRFSPTERRWSTTDPATVRRLEVALRGVPREHARRAVRPTPARRPRRPVRAYG